MEDTMRRRRFEEAIRNVVAKLNREGKDRIERTHIEEIGEQCGLDPNEARKLFVASRGDIWRGKFIESDEEPRWEAATLESAPDAGGDAPDDLSV